MISVLLVDDHQVVRAGLRGGGLSEQVGRRHRSHRRHRSRGARPLLSAAPSPSQRHSATICSRITRHEPGQAESHDFMSLLNATRAGRATQPPGKPLRRQRQRWPLLQPSWRLRPAWQARRVPRVARPASLRLTAPEPRARTGREGDPGPRAGALRPRVPRAAHPADRGIGPRCIRPAMHPGWAAVPNRPRRNENITKRNVVFTFLTPKAPLCVAPRANGGAIHRSPRLAGPAPRRPRCDAAGSDEEAAPGRWRKVAVAPSRGLSGGPPAAPAPPI